VTNWHLQWTSGRTIVALVKAEAPACPVLAITRAMPFVLDFRDMVCRAGADEYAAKSPDMRFVREAARLLLRRPDTA
jgi:DNA-binding response OmpR family regulator